MPSADGRVIDPMPSSRTAVCGVDRAAFAVSLSVRLQQAGVPVGFTGMGALVRAMDIVPPGLAAVAVLGDPYLPGPTAERPRLVRRGLRGGIRRHRCRPRPACSPPASPGRGERGRAGVHLGSALLRRGGRRPALGDASRMTSTPERKRVASAVPERLPSGLEGLADTPFDELDPAQLALLSGWLESALASWPTRRTRRQSAHPAGRRTALRPTLARARRTGWEPIELVRTRPVHKRRRVVMLCDVSQSMQSYAAAYLHLMRAVALTTDAEVFAFATTLTRLTSVLAHKSPELAMQQATEKVADRFGGTRIASNIRALLASRHGGAIRGAIVIIASDGWDSDPPDELAKVMARLHRRAYRVLWLNPRAAASGLRPSCRSHGCRPALLRRRAPGAQRSGLGRRGERHCARRPIGRRQLQRVT